MWKHVSRRTVLKGGEDAAKLEAVHAAGVVHIRLREGHLRDRVHVVAGLLHERADAALNFLQLSGSNLTIQVQTRHFRFKS